MSRSAGSVCAPLFPHSSRRKLSGMSMLLRRMGRDRINVHGFCSTFRDWAGESTSFPREVAAHALAHQLADKAESAYQCGTPFRKSIELMAAWAAFCVSLVADGASIVGIRAECYQSGEHVIAFIQENPVQ